MSAFLTGAFMLPFTPAMLDKDEWTRQDGGRPLFGQYYQQGSESEKNETANAFSEEMESDHPGSTLPLPHNEEKREAFLSFFSSSFLISLIADGSISDPRDAITDRFCFTSSSKSSSTLSHHFDKSICGRGSSFLFTLQRRRRRRNFLRVPDGR